MTQNHDPLERIFKGARKAQTSDAQAGMPPLFSTNVLRALRNQGFGATPSGEADAWEHLSLAAVPIGAFVALVSLVLAAYQPPLENTFNEPESVASAMIIETIEP